MIHISSDYSALEKELDRLKGMPGPKARALLNAVLKEGFVTSQARVHVITGSLKSSGKSSSKGSKATHTWEGTIEYGGPSKSVNNPVDYAIYEKARGEDHDFMGNLHLLHSQYITAIEAGLRG